MRTALIVIGAILLFPGMCSVAFTFGFPSLILDALTHGGDDYGVRELWLGGLVVGALGMALILKGRR